MPFHVEVANDVVVKLCVGDKAQVSLLIHLLMSMTDIDEAIKSIEIDESNQLVINKHDSG